MIKLQDTKLWMDADGKECPDEFVTKQLAEYTRKGGKIFVGSDSMFCAGQCSFAAVIALHDRNQKVAKYYYKKLKRKSNVYSDLKTKIFEEVNLSIQVAKHVRNICPNANIELHVDIGNKQVNLTKKFYNLVKGWVTGTGFKFKIKPESWASSSVADWHTK